MKKALSAALCAAFVVTAFVAAGLAPEPLPPRNAQCAYKPHFVWTMPVISDTDVPPCVMLGRYKPHHKPSMIFEDVDGTIYEAYGNTVHFPDTMGFTWFVNYQDLMSLRRAYAATLKALLQPYCPHSEPIVAQPVLGVAQQVYPMTIHCADGSVVTVTYTINKGH